MRLADALGAMLLFGLIGCAPDRNLAPEPPPHEYTVPPDEARYSRPIEYPKDSLHQDIHQSRIKDGFKKPDAGLKRPGGMMGGPGS